MADAFTVTGDEEVSRRLKALPKKVQRRVLRPALRDGAKIVQSVAKQTVPVQRGKLARSIKVRAAKRSRNRVGMRVMAMMPYVGFVEYGTKKMRARHFMQIAFDRAAEASKQKTMQVIVEGIEREAASG